MPTVIVASRRLIAEDICEFELVASDGTALPPFSAGAHIDVHLPGNLIRQYSLCNAPSERHRYQIAVLKDPASRGGSASMHDDIQVGDRLSISDPRNLFPLTGGAPSALLFAGGIGITPILSMAEHLGPQNRSFSLHYCVRTPERAAYRDRISSAFADKSTIYYADEGPPFNARAVLSQSDNTAHIYACGPVAFMDHIFDIARELGWSDDNLHREHFVSSPTKQSGDAAFHVKIASTGQMLEVPADQTAAAILTAQGFDIPLSCEQGICGTCLTRVLEGVPDHRDVYQTDAEQATNDHFTPCCSRSLGPVLVLDL